MNIFRLPFTASAQKACRKPSSSLNGLVQKMAEAKVVHDISFNSLTDEAVSANAFWGEHVMPFDFSEAMLQLVLNNEETWTKNLKKVREQDLATATKAAREAIKTSPTNSPLTNSAARFLLDNFNTIRLMLIGQGATIHPRKGDEVRGKAYALAECIDILTDIIPCSKQHAVRAQELLRRTENERRDMIEMNGRNPSGANCVYI